MSSRGALGAATGTLFPLLLPLTLAAAFCDELNGVRFGCWLIRFCCECDLDSGGAVSSFCFCCSTSGQQRKFQLDFDRIRNKTAKKMTVQDDKSILVKNGARFERCQQRYSINKAGRVDRPIPRLDMILTDRGTTLIQTQKKRRDQSRLAKIGDQKFRPVSECRQISSSFQIRK